MMLDNWKDRRILLVLHLFHEGGIDDRLLSFTTIPHHPAVTVQIAIYQHQLEVDLADDGTIEAAKVIPILSAVTEFEP